MFWWSLQGKTGTLYLKIVRLGYTNSISKTVKIIQFIPTSQNYQPQPRPKHTMSYTNTNNVLSTIIKRGGELC